MMIRGEFTDMIKDIFGKFWSWIILTVLALLIFYNLFSLL